MFKLNYYFYWCLMMLVFSFIFMYLSLMFMYNDNMILIEWEIFNLNSLSFLYVLVFDWMSMVFSSVVLFISSMIISYSFFYMGLNSYSSLRFLFLVNLFIMSMFLMVMSPNMLSIMLGWDGLGLVSYCLVIYYSSMKSYLAGMITFLTNRIGDIGLLISLCWMFSFGSLHIMFYNDLLDLHIFYMIIFSSFTKSAQMPFSCWLPAAMSAPTPVSSLVHSSTLVTAGVYLLIRFHNFMMVNWGFFFISFLTMFMASFCANYEFDLKSIIALSTLSQLGLMMSSLFLGFVDLSFFHLLTHAMFKSLLFLCSGIFIYYMSDNQDIRMMGSICKMMPFTSSCFNISSLALCGVPFLSGFYSKDLIIENFSNSGSLVFMSLLMYFCLGMTSCYSIRLFYYSMIYNNKFISFNFFSDEINLMKFNIFILTFFSVIFGGTLMWLINLDLNFFLIPFEMKISSLFSVFLGFWFGLELFNFKNYMSMNFYLFNSFMWFMFSHSGFFYMFFFYFSIKSSKITQGWGEYYGGISSSYFLLKLASFFQKYSMSSMKMFLLSFLVWLIILL
nr:NADH dehydrogenase subunit 5 [Nionia sp.]